VAPSGPASPGATIPPSGSGSALGTVAAAAGAAIAAQSSTAGRVKV
jgi:hypothetical protein